MIIFEYFSLIFTHQSCRSYKTLPLIDTNNKEIYVLLFDTLGIKNPLEKKKYHELTFYQKVWLMKGLCDWCLVSYIFTNSLTSLCNFYLLALLKAKKTLLTD